MAPPTSSAPTAWCRPWGRRRSCARLRSIGPWGWSTAGWRKIGRRRLDQALRSQERKPKLPSPPLRLPKLEIAVIRFQRPVALVGFGHDSHRDDFTWLFAEKAPVVCRDVTYLIVPHPHILTPAT